MGIVDKFKNLPGVDKFYRVANTPPINKEIVSSIGVTDFWVLDGARYNPDNIKIETYDKIYKQYQVKACLNIIRYSLQQVDWFIKTDDEEQEKVISYAIEKIWNNLLKSIAKSFRYGFSPTVKVFTLEEIDGKQRIIYSKIKDLDPKLCDVKVDKWGNYDGFIYKKNSTLEKVIVKPEYSFWYSSDMENGNLYGNSMLQDVYKPWYYSEKVHGYANRYYERFGEPLVVGRAPSGGSKVKDSNGKTMDAQDVMSLVIDSIRSHSSAQLPSDKDQEGKDYLYDIKYLESQMRGFDFDNYLGRLDTEITRALLVPDLMFSSGSGGSYGLGAAQIESFYTNLMGIMDNIVDYVNLYIIPQLIEYNFGKGNAKIAYQPLSIDSKKFINEMINNLITKGSIKPDMDQIEERSGFKFEEIEIKEDVATGADVKKALDDNNKKVNKKVEAAAEVIARRILMEKETDELRELKSKLENE
jgi:hypothetical protein